MTFEKIIEGLSPIITRNSNKHYFACNFTPGERYRIVWMGKSGANYGNNTSGTWITLVKNGVKFGIGQKRCYGNANEAFLVANLWRTLLDNSTTAWNYYFDTIYVLDTKTNEYIVSLKTERE